MNISFIYPKQILIKSQQSVYFPRPHVIIIVKHISVSMTEVIIIVKHISISMTEVTYKSEVNIVNSSHWVHTTLY